VSIAQDLRTRVRHRGKTPWQLVKTISRLEREADERTCHLVAMATENDELRAERNQLEAQLDTAGIELSGARHDLHVASKETLRLQAAVQAWEARWANAHPIRVPAPRDLPAIVPITPIYPITERAAASDATNPAHIPTT
jgi:hypothetical protein